ncbi:hypothetical protein IBK38_27245, partial [Escherichia coli]
DEGRQLIEDFDDEFNEDELTLTQKERSKWARIEGLIGSSKRIKAIAAGHGNNHALTMIGIGF